MSITMDEEIKRWTAEGDAAGVGVGEFLPFQCAAAFCLDRFELLAQWFEAKLRSPVVDVHHHAEPCIAWLTVPLRMKPARPSEIWIQCCGRGFCGLIVEVRSTSRATNRVG